MKASERFHWTVVLIISLHLMVVVPLALLLPIWDDEVYTLRTASHGLVESLTLGVTFERQAPLYFGIASLLRRIGDSYSILRLFSVCCTTATLAISSRISKQLFPRLSPVWLVAILAFNPLVLFAAVEIRVYALELLIATALISLFVDGYLKSGYRHWSRWALVGLASVGLYTHYYLGFLLVAFAVGLLVTRRKAHFLRYVLQLVVVTILVLPVLYWVRLQLNQSDGSPRDTFSFWESVRFFLGLVRELVVPAGAAFVNRSMEFIHKPSLAAPMRNVLTILIAVAAVSARKTSRAGRKHVVTICWTLLLTLALLLTAAGGFAGGAFVNLTRYWTVAVVPGALAVVAILAVTESPVLVIGTVMALVGTNAWHAFVEYRPLAKKGDAERVAAYLRANEARDNVIAVFPNYSALALEWYYAGQNRIRAIPSPVNLTRYNLAEGVVHSECEVADSIRPDVGQGKFVWLVFEPNTNVQGVDYGPQKVMNYFERNYDLVQEHKFYKGLSVRLMRQRSPSIECYDSK